MAAGRSSSIIKISTLALAVLICCPYVAAGISTIRPGDELNSTSFIVSKGGEFTLGFFFIEETNATYLGIWYTKDEYQDKVWVANPNSPIMSSNISGTVLTMDSRGILTITSGSEGTIFMDIPDQEITASNYRPVATLENSGNLKVFDETDNWTLWQSFDHPNNALLQGMKLGYNSATKQNWNLTSWVSTSYPASGSFTLTWEPSQDTGQLVLYRRGERYWTSGLLKNQEFEHISFNPPLDLNITYRLNITSNNDEKSFSFHSSSRDAFMWHLRPDGKIEASPSGQILNGMDFCYGYELNNGCVASGQPHCRRNIDKFEQKRAFFFNTTTDEDGNSSLSLSDCMTKCWNTCDCVGFEVGFIINGTGCITYLGKLDYREDNINNQLTYVLVRGHSSKGKVWIWVIIAVTVSTLFLILGTFACLRMRKHRLKAEEERRRKDYLHELIASDSFKHVDSGGAEGHDLKMLSFATIVEATRSFSEENKLGEGGFGPVFKGTLQDGREIAIKRLSKTSGQGLVEFKNELILIAKLQHKNLVRVLGCCIHEEEKMLIYEYLPNKSLDFFIFDLTKRGLLDFKSRMIIIEGIAQGLIYLHKYSRMRVIHRDLKASNVLLDENMNPKIADFGLARIFKQNETEAMTNRVVGTYGYMSTEYAMEGTFSEKSDVFSFGVLVLEIMSGRRNSSFHQFGNRYLNLIGYAWEMWKDGIALELKDQMLGESCDENQMLRTIQVGLLCVQEDSTDRPAMSEVISMLSTESIALPPPKQPAFFTGRNQLDSITASSSDSKLKYGSVNDLTVSATQAR